MSPTRSATTATDDTSADDAATDATITVRFTDSVADAPPSLAALHDLDATVTFPSLTRAYAFGERLDHRDDSRSYRLEPDHDGDATLYLYCEEPRR